MDKQRINYSQAAPGAINGLLAIEKYVEESGFDRVIFELVKCRASQINGCAYCLDMHTKDARLAGETEQRLYTLPAWRETPFFTEQERAALAWTESLTLISTNDVSEELYQEVRKHFSEKELVDLTMIIVAINGWNRLSVAFKTPAGTYTPPKK